MGERTVQPGDWVKIAKGVFVEGYDLSGERAMVIDNQGHILVKIKVKDIRGQEQIKYFKLLTWEIDDT